MDIRELTKLYGIALTGGIATGKSTVGRILNDLGFTVIDADLLARRAVAIGSPALAKIQSEFGPDCISEDGSLNRKYLSKIVFSNPARLKVLEEITHPVIEHLLHQRLTEKGLLADPKIWFYEAALIFENEQQKKFRQVWSTYCPEVEQIRRLMARDSIDEPTARRIISSQIPAIEKKSRADIVIDTMIGGAEIRKQLIELANL